jgi:hypothetical protein
MRAEKNSTTDTSTNARAIELLKAPDFFPRLLQTLQREGLVGEERNAQVLYIVAASSLLKRPINAILKGRSSSGKNFVGNHVLRLLPKNAVREITSSSKTAWNYGEDDFCHKVVYLQERNDAAGAIHPVRLLISEGQLRRIVTVREKGVWVQKTVVARGPISSISTTTRDRIEIDDETRHISLWVDESCEQNRRIIMNCLSDRPEERAGQLRVWKQAYRFIEERAATARVVLPSWFGQIGDNVYAGSVTVRRYFPAFVEACRTLALLRSFQKHSEGNDVTLRDLIEVDFVDYSVAAILFESVFVESLHRTADKNSATRLAVEKISKEKNGTGVTAKELALHLSISEDRAYARLRSATQAGVVERANEPQRGNLKLYRPVDLPRFVPEPQSVFSKINGIPSPVEFIHPLTGDPVRFSRRASQTKKSSTQGGKS